MSIQATFNAPQDISGYTLFSNPDASTYVYVSNANPTSIPFFMNNTKLISIIFPSSITSIDDATFYGTGLTSITIPSSVTNIGNQTFQSCGWLSSVTIQSSVTIGFQTFLDCPITSVTFPFITSIGDGSFAGCILLTSVTIPLTCTSIGVSAFSACRMLTSITIPSSVTSIGSNAFMDTALTSVSLPSDINLETDAFPSETVITYYGEDTSVIQATFNSSQNISGYTFFSNPDEKTYVYVSNANPTSIPLIISPNLISITIPSSVSSISSGAFNSCTELTAITLPSTLTSIGDSAFQSCTALISITIPPSVTSIGNYAFSLCTGLTSITIPSSVTNIGIQVFLNCTGLTSIIVNSSNPNYSSDSSGVLYNNTQTQLILCPPKFTGTYTIPSSVTIIEDLAFALCSGLTAVTIPSSVTSVGDNAFYNCTGLTAVTIPSSVTSIGANVFYNCIGLTAVTIPLSVTSIGIQTFYYCTKLTSVSLHSGIILGTEAFPSATVITYYGGDTSIQATFNSAQTIPGYTFFSNPDATTYVYVSNVNPTSIPSAAFNSAGLISIIIPSSVTSIDSNAFQNCTELTSITVNSSNPNYSSDSQGALYNYGKTQLILCPPGFTGAYTIQNTCTSISNNAFNINVSVYDIFTRRDSTTLFGCTGLTAVTIPSSVTSIGSQAFDACTGLTAVNIPSSVTSIGDSAFYNCTGLTTVTIPASVNSIGNNTFNSCYGLTAVTIPSSVNSISSQAFYYCYGLTAVTIPSSVTSIGDSAFQGTGLTLVSLPFGITLGNHAFLSASGTTIAITYYGGDTSIQATFNSAQTIPGYTFFSTLDSTAYVYVSNVNPTSIPSAAFNSAGLISIIIPSSVTSIDSNAFISCIGLTSITVNSSNPNYSSDSSGVLYNKGQTQLILCPPGFIGAYTILDTCTSIANNSFNINNYTPIWGGGFIIALFGCKGLTAVTIPASVTSIGDSAFASCTGLTAVTIPSSVTSIGDSAFNNCTGLTAVTILSSVNSIGNNTFNNCTGLTAVTIPSSVNSIGIQAFYYCYGLTAVTIPASVTSIGDSAFQGTGLTAVSLPVTEIIGANAFPSTTVITWTGSFVQLAFSSPQSNFNNSVIFGPSSYILLYGSTYIYALLTTTIPGNALNNQDLTAISIPSNVTNVDAGAFLGCASLTSITVDSTSTYYSADSQGALYNYGKTILIAFPPGFKGSYNAIPATCRSIGISAFNGTTGLTAITIPATCTSIGASAFLGTGLKTVTLSSGTSYNLTNSFPSSTILSMYDTSSSSSSFSSAYSASLTTPISTICFPAKTPINTDQGIIHIEKINAEIHTINNKKINAITQTISLENYLVCFEKHSLGKNYPSQKTTMSPYHKINYKGKLIEAKKFINKFEHVKKIKYTGEILYNVLMETHDKMVVNNLSVETLHPNNIIAKLYTSRYTETDKNDIIILMNDCIKKNDLVTYKKIINKF